jgi:hypothetical protein
MFFVFFWHRNVFSRFPLDFLLRISFAVWEPVLAHAKEANYEKLKTALRAMNLNTPHLPDNSVAKSLASLSIQEQKQDSDGDTY